MLPELPPKVNAKKKTVVSIEKQKKFHRTSKFNLSHENNADIKKLKKALEAKKGKTISHPRIKFHKQRHIMSKKPLAKKEVKIDTTLIFNPLDNPNFYWSLKDVKNNLIVPTHIMGQLKLQYHKYRK